MSHTAFEEKKCRILDTLAVPEDVYHDASPKGSVDEGIRELVDSINVRTGLVTTSSCAGRIAIYVEGTASTADASELVAATTKSTGGKGGGRWLYVSHDPVDVDGIIDDEQLLQTLSLRSGNTSETAASTSAYVHLKFEPMILHILCCSMTHARKVLGAALSAGFRESGISSVNDEQDMIMVGIRTNGLAFDSIIGRTIDDSDDLQLLVSSDHIRLLIALSNRRFETNQQRKDRFSTGLMQALDDRTKNKAPNWEPAEVRRARKRAEGLARQQELQSQLEHTSP